MKKEKLHVTKSHKMPSIRAWFLEPPRKDNSTFTQEGIRGWVFPEKPDDQIDLALLVDGVVTWIGRPTIAAPGAREAVFGSESAKWNSVARFHVPVTDQGSLIELVFNCSGNKYVALSITRTTREIGSAFKVQRGLRGMLFLDNDTNRSVDQYTGRLLLGNHAMDEWRAYVHGLQDLSACGCPVRMMICPAKEEVFPDLYPHARANVTPLDQVLTLISPKQLVYPLSELVTERDRAFSLIDTHWSDYGAVVGARSYLNSISLGWASRHLPNLFLSHRRYGDLGGKLPEKQLGEFEIVNPEVMPAPVFSNGITNHGRIWVYKTSDAPVNTTLVIFGDSYSVSLSAILAKIFARVVYAYTAGEILYDVIEKETPSHILCQTNQRFTMTAPRCGTTLARKVEHNISKLDPSQVVMLDHNDAACDYYKSCTTGRAGGLNSEPLKAVENLVPCNIHKFG